jgi:DnaJ-domain-containing protein 1
MSAGAAERRKGQPLHLYAIVASGQHGQDAPASTDTIADGLSTIVAGPYSAVVGGGPGPDLKGRSREDLGHLLIAHQKVIEQLMRTAPVLPVKFGTWMPDAKGIRELLERGRPLLDSTFAELKGCTQLEVSVTWDVEAVFADIAGEEAVARLKAQIADNGQAATTAQRLALGRLVKAALERRRAAVATQISHALRAVAVDAIASPVAADRVVLHLVLLLKIDALGEVDRCLETLDAAYGARLCFRCVGPMPPANFATLEIERLESAEMERAGRILGVAPTASLDDVRCAYRRLARAAHPDASDRCEGKAGTMAALSDAYRALARYARPRGGSTRRRHMRFRSQYCRASRARLDPATGRGEPRRSVRRRKLRNACPPPNLASTPTGLSTCATGTTSPVRPPSTGCAGVPYGRCRAPRSQLSSATCRRRPAPRSRRSGTIPIGSRA